MSDLKTLVIGASPQPDRYSYKAIERLRQHGHDVVAFGVKTGQVADVVLRKTWPQDTDIDTVTLYINPTLQEQYYDQIVALKPRRVIFNPGTENHTFERLLASHQINTLEASYQSILIS
jgi:predicted CoA-binding protein